MSEFVSDIGLDVHAETIAAAAAEKGGEVRLAEETYYGMRQRTAQTSHNAVERWPKERSQSPARAPERPTEPKLSPLVKKPPAPLHRSLLQTVARNAGAPANSFNQRLHWGFRPMLTKFVRPWFG
jgi:hypothetical protein